MRSSGSRTTGLTELDLGGLEVVGREVAIHSLDFIDTLYFPNLRETDEFRLLDNPGLRAVEAPGLRVTGGIVEIGHNPAFEELTFGSGDGSFARIHNNDSLVRIVGLRRVHDDAVAELVARVTAEDSVKTGNKRDEITALDPCPWLGDRICDATIDTCGNPGTRLCAEDPADCACE